MVALQEHGRLPDPGEPHRLLSCRENIAGICRMDLLARFKVMQKRLGGFGVHQHVELWPSLAETPDPERRWEESTPQ